MQQASWTSSDDGELLDEHWPSQGQIQFVNYSTKYREGLDLVLKGLDCTIKGGEKVSASYFFILVQSYIQ